MAASVRVAAPAKVNLHLRVYGLRPDGYHGIRSLFQAISLSDGIVVRSLKEPDIVVIDGDFNCPPEKTTVYKAVAAFREATGIRTGLSVLVDKRVPAGAGLGGGSGDAAAVLRALDALFGARLDSSELVRIGADIGSDVPFFFTGGAAIVSGRGEMVAAIPARVDYCLVIVYPGFSVSTARAYALLDAARPEDSREADLDPSELETAYRGDPAAWPFINSFEQVMGDANPEIFRIRDRLRSLGALFAIMSGSGSSVLGLFRGFPDAEAARLDLVDDGLWAFTAFPLARAPSVE